MLQLKLHASLSISHTHTNANTTHTLESSSTALTSEPYAQYPTTPSARYTGTNTRCAAAAAATMARVVLPVLGSSRSTDCTSGSTVMPYRNSRMPTPLNAFNTSASAPPLDAASRA